MDIDYSEDPVWKECLKRYIKAEELMGVKKLLFVKNGICRITKPLNEVSPHTFQKLIKELLKHYEIWEKAGKFS